ncbi:MAG: multicopper oxidase family protein [Mycobacteriales bacterium]
MTVFKRRDVLRAGVAGGALAAASIPLAKVAFAPSSTSRRVRLTAGQAAIPGGSLDPTTIPKYVTSLFIPPAMPPTSTASGLDQYAIVARQFSQQILPPGMHATTVFGYGSATDSSTLHTPCPTIEARVGRPVRVRWINGLMTSDGHFVPHPLTVDPTLHWANPPGGTAGRDSRPTFSDTPPPYAGPVPTVTHLHGSHSTEESDGYPDAWFLPAARDIPSGYAQVGSFYNQFAAKSASLTGVSWPRGSAIFNYTNDQRATGLWFHDHTIGMTRLGVQAGLLGAYLLRGGSADLPSGVLPGPAPGPNDPPGTKYYEIPLLFQDHSFNSDGSMFFPTSRGFFGDTPPDGPWIPFTDVSPMWNPEYFGNVMTVNGRSWPSLAVEQRRYRFRMTNANNARTMILKIVANPQASRPVSPALPFAQIGTDGGFLPAPVQLGQILLGPGERADVIVDFTRVPVGTALYLINEGPDEPFGGGTVGTDFDPSDPATTGQVLRFTVIPRTSPDNSTPPGRLRLPSITPIGTPTTTRKLSLNELDSGTFADAPEVGMLGTLASDGTGNPLHWGDAITETPKSGTIEMWELSNFTDDAHPIHLHQVQFQVVNRQAFGEASRPPERWESGFKDTVISYPKQFTRVKARWDIPGRYVWHCHILDHEDNEMMRPLQVLS